MRFRQNRWVSGALRATFIPLFFSSVSFAAETLPEPEGEVVVRTEEDLARGKENVRTVVDELKALFATNRPPQPTAVAKPVAEPYSQLVKGADGRSTLIFRPRFTSSKQMFRALDGIVSATTLCESVDEQNVIIINGEDSDIESYKAIMIAMDVPSAQILIEAKVVEVLFTDGMQRNLSINYSTNRGSVGANTEVPGVNKQPTNGLGGAFTPIAGEDNLSIAFDWLLTAQDARVLSSPNILISRNEVARIVTGEDIPIQEAQTVSNNLNITTKFKNVGVTLEVEPNMINGDNVTLRIFPQVSNVTRYETITTGSGVGASSYSVPVISVRSVETYLRMLDQQVVMMGGLYSSRNTLQQQRVPFLSDLPYLGEFFTGKNYSKEVTQLIFFLKIHIISPEEVSGGLFFDPNRSAEVSEKLGEALNSMETFPIHRTSVENLEDEFRNSISARNEEERRDAFHSEVRVEVGEKGDQQ